MKPILEEALEQLTGPKKPPPKPQGMKEQLDPGKAVREAMRQALGFSGEKKIPTQEELSRMQDSERESTRAEIQTQRANLALINPPRKEVQPEVQNPAEKAALDNKKHLPELVEPVSKPKRGSVHPVLQRKQRAPEIKSGPSG